MDPAGTALGECTYIQNPFAEPGEAAFMPLNEILRKIVSQFSLNKLNDDVVVNAKYITMYTSEEAFLYSNKNITLSAEGDIHMHVNHQTMSITGLLQRISQLESVVENLVMETRLATQHAQTSEWMFFRSIKE